MINENTDKVLAAVKKAKIEFDSAESDFDRESSRIQRMASYSTININNMSRAVEIMADVKRTTDALYVSYETIIRTLDMECRPYLELGIKSEAIKEVAEMMKKINRESSGLSSNTSGSFNGVSLGDIRSEYYVASIEARSIEQFWVSRYESTPEAEEERQARALALAERQKKAAERKRLEAERKKKEAERKKKEAEEKALEEKRIAEINSIAKKHMNDIEDECNRRIAEYKKELELYIEQQNLKYQKEIEGKIIELKKSIEELQVRETQLSVFKMIEKREIRDEIKKIESRIVKYQKTTAITDAIDSMKEKLTIAVEEYQKAIEQYMSNRFSDYKSNSKKKAKTTLMYVENADFANKPIPQPVSPKEFFK